MGIDLKDRGRTKSTRRKVLKSDNPYLKLLVELYQFLARRTGSAFNKVVAKRLMMAQRFKAPVSLSKAAEHMKGQTDKTAVVVGTVTSTICFLFDPHGLQQSIVSLWLCVNSSDDIRLLDVPPMQICALRFTETARARIIAAGGACLTFDQLALRAPRGT